MCLARVNPVTLAVGNTVKRVVIIAAAMVVLGEAMEPAMATVVPTMATGSMASPNTTMAAAMITTRFTVLPTCVEINQCVGCTRQFFTKSFLGDGAAVLARSSGEERAPPRYRAGVASMAWRTTRRLRTNAP